VQQNYLDVARALWDDCLVSKIDILNFYYFVAYTFEKPQYLFFSTFSFIQFYRLRVKTCLPAGRHLSIERLQNL
ncbi:MAG: hypothetical protein ACI8V8_002061, partial [Chitinophagales bacterium]